ncbi:hypothetical protein MBLNU457_g2605t1 [Dothideomycetes sp. NU457]
MGNDMPYMYNYAQQSGSTFEFNPRAYTQSINYAASAQSEARRSRQLQKGPLVEINRHPDSWMVVASTTNTATVSPHVKEGILVTRWVQFSLRLLQLLVAVGIFVCTVCIRGTQDAATYLLRIPPAYDVFICSYAVYHLSAHPKRRTAASSASYHFFSICMDAGLVPFYVYISLFAQNNWASAVGTEGRWRSYFDQDWQTNIVLYTVFIASAVVAGLHVFSLVLDVLFVMWFRKIAKLSPDNNPLEDNVKTSKHQHKNSEMTGSSLTLEKSHLSGTTLSFNNRSTVSLPKGFSVVETPDARHMPFSYTRMNSDSSFVPLNMDSRRASRADLLDQAGLYSESIARASKTDLLRPGSRPTSRPQSRSHSRSQSRSQSRGRPRSYVSEHDPMPERVTSPGSFFTAESDARSRASPSPGPQAAIGDATAKRQQTDNLLNDNWYVMDDGSDVGTPVREQTPRQEYRDSVHEYMVKPGSRTSLPKPLTANPPMPPPKSPERYRQARMNERVVEQETVTDPEEIGRALTMGSSLYSDATSIKDSDSAKPRYYGNIGGFHANEAKPLPMTPNNGNGRVVSRSGVDIGDVSMAAFEDGRSYGRRNVSGAVMEEGRGTWDVRRRQVSGTA